MTEQDRAATLPPDDACDCLVPWLDGAGNHSPGCAIFRWKSPHIEVSHPTPQPIGGCTAVDLDADQSGSGEVSRG